MSDGEKRNSFRRILEEKYGELKEQGCVRDSEEPDTDNALYKMVGKAMSLQMAYDIIGSLKSSFDGEGYGMPGTVIFDINHHPDNREIWKFIEGHNETIHYLDNRTDRFYFDDDNITTMLKLMI